MPFFSPKFKNISRIELYKPQFGIVNELFSGIYQFVWFVTRLLHDNPGFKRVEFNCFLL